MTTTNRRNLKKILFIPTNGAGLGHLTRCLAIARRIKKLDASNEILFFTTSSAMQLIFQEGYLGYHLPSKTLFPPNYTKNWNALYKEHLRLIIQLHRPDCIVFDGVFPYAGLLASLRESKGIKKIWLRRGQSKLNEDALSSKERDFDKIIIPGELGKGPGVKHQQKLYFTNPIVYLDKSELASRDKIRKKWLIPENHKLVFVQLGAGNINDINSTITKILKVLANRQDVSIVLGESIISKTKLELEQERLTTIRDYPLSQYFNAFDLAITAAGYNTFHELMYFNVPSILIPNSETKNDNQQTRALYAEQIGTAIVAKSTEYMYLEKLITQALTDEKLQSLKETFRQNPLKNGADEVATFLVNHYL